MKNPKQRSNRTPKTAPAAVNKDLNVNVQAEKPVFFTNERYVTKKIYKSLPRELQQFMWDCIDGLAKDGTELDYLQKFSISSAGQGTKITHVQELPQHCSVYFQPFFQCGNAQIYVIDDGTCSTMMFTEEF
jgi:hypothetical protein